MLIFVEANDGYEIQQSECYLAVYLLVILLGFRMQFPPPLTKRRKFVQQASFSGDLLAIFV